MTGFGEARGRDHRLSVHVEVRAVNNRYLKILTKSPEPYQPLEGEIERVVRDAISRGTVNVVLRLDSLEPRAAYRLDGNLLKAYWRQLLALQDELSAPAGNLAALLELPGVVVEGAEPSDDPRADWPLIESTLRLALSKLGEFRAAEGASMERDLVENLRIVSTELEKIAARGPQIVVDFRDRLRERVADLLRDSEATVQPADLLREVSIFAERCDISEEITRLRSHLEQFESFLLRPQSQGRKLEFLTQEMVREVNTIGSKANNVDVAHAVVEIKAAVERLREVLQNVE
jgi:uncharacterized protein (TIGR00255 family)